MSHRLSDKVCIITGTGGSMGREAARTFAREGASVVGCDLNIDAAQATVDMIRAEGGKMVSLQPCHLTKPSDCQARWPHSDRLLAWPGTRRPRQR
jgi:NAD(P)-dependent dehydrogenase (short-subunit alcohol dehydrogenase family)